MKIVDDPTVISSEMEKQNIHWENCSFPRKNEFATATKRDRKIINNNFNIFREF